MIPLLLALALMADTPDLSYEPPASGARAEAIRRSEEKPEESDPKAWKAEDTALQALFGLAMLGDYLQTRRITREGREVNPIIGKRGQRVPPELYFPLTFGLHTGAMYLLPKPWRNIAQGLSVGFEGGVVGRNAALGYGFKF